MAERDVWVVMTDTVVQGPIISQWEDDMPAFYPTQAAAELEVVDRLMLELQEVKDGLRSFEEVGLDQEWVEPATWDGKVLALQGNEFTRQDLERMR